MPNPIPAPGPGILGGIPVVGPIYDAAGNLLGHFDPNGHFIKAVTGAEKKLIGGVVQGATKDIFKGLDLQGVFLRLGEIILGVVLIGVGVAKLTGVDNTIAKTATKLGKAALL